MSKQTQECIICEGVFQRGRVIKGKLICANCCLEMTAKMRFENHEKQLPKV